MTDLLSTADVMLDLQVPSRRSLLEVLSEEAANRLGHPRQAILEALEAREQLGSTALRDGVALPHAHVEGLPRPVVLFARLRQPIYFDPADDEPIDLVFLILWPASDKKGLLPAMGEICAGLRDPQVLRRLRQVSTGDETVKVLTGMRKHGTGGPDQQE
jgi:PTS system nitrogen regulatory IIA component